MKAHLLTCALWLAGGLLSAPAAGSPAKIYGSGLDTFYRGDARSPDQVKAAGGFKTRAAPQSPKAYSVRNHVEELKSNLDTVYVSTSEAIGPAIRFANARRAGYVYRIQGTPNAVDVNKSYREAGLRNARYESQLEHVFAGGVAWTQVRGWERVSMQGNKVARGKFEENPDYDHAFDAFRAAGAAPQLVVEKAGRPIQQEYSRFMANANNAQARAVPGWAPSFCAGAPSKRQEGGCVESYAPPGSDAYFGRCPGPPRSAIRSDQPVSLGQWLMLGADVLFMAASLIPTPAAPAFQALRVARVALKATNAVKKVIGAGRKVAKAGQSVRRAQQAVERVEGVLASSKLNVAKEPAGASTSVGNVVRTADRIEAPANRPGETALLSEEKVNELLKKLDDVVVPSDPIRAPMENAARSAGQGSKTAVALPGKRAASTGAFADDVAVFADFVARRQPVPADLLERMMPQFEVKLAEAAGQTVEEANTFLNNDMLFSALANEFTAPF
ncbi:hypothetical protein HIM_06198 [Hirsutella minnesotensis 3608]|uniref:Enterotoxin n=1 Tax=Hirsutella minnesotensis 3608 TaxID=1043627 RepID=A0A0F7ZU78_9HYPO|nr:hypothetical protein HIM_06198 [Hirsutella minnesotensis 3608]